MASDRNFQPRWASPPGETIIDILEERSVPRSAFAEMIGLAQSRLPGLLSGAETITIDLARQISTSIGGSVEFWLTRDGQYRDDLEFVAAAQWADSMPTSQMARLGWIKRPADWHDAVTSCLEFFDVSNLAEWEQTYGSLVTTARYRRSEKVPSDENTTVAWLRQAEVEASQILCVPWDRELFSEALSDLRPLTRMSDPRRFLPVLIERCASAGVALVVLRAPEGCAVSGVARHLKDGRAQIVLSARYLSDDHLWFTFFHEAGHLLLHDPHSMYVDEIGRTTERPTSEDEREADAFATGALVPEPVRIRLLELGRPTPAQLRSAARDAGVSIGILVGQLQHEGVIGFDSVLNKLKHRYRWVGSSLEKA